MFNIGVGPALALFVVIGAAGFDIPVVISAPLAAVIMCGVAYAVSRERQILQIGTATVVVASMPFLTRAMNLQGTQDGLPDWMQQMVRIMGSDACIIAVSAIAFILAMVYGIFGPLRHLKKVEDLLREHEGR